MLNLSKKSVTKHHRFNYHPRNFDEKKEAFKKRRKIIENRLEKPGFDVLEHYQKKKKKKAIRYDLIFIALLFFVTLFLFSDLQKYFKNSIFNNSNKITIGGIPIDSSGMAGYLFLISLGFIFIKRSKKKNV